MAGVGINDNLQAGNTLLQNIPNPCNSSTTIRFSLIHGGFITLKLYDVSGKEVRTVINGNLNAGIQQVSVPVSALDAGIYYYTLQSQDGKSTRKMVVVK